MFELSLQISRVQQSLLSLLLNSFVQTRLLYLYSEWRLTIRTYRSLVQQFQATHSVLNLRLLLLIGLRFLYFGINDLIRWLFICRCFLFQSFLRVLKERSILWLESRSRLRRHFIYSLSRFLSHLFDLPRHFLRLFLQLCLFTTVFLFWRPSHFWSALFD